MAARSPLATGPGAGPDAFPHGQARADGHTPPVAPARANAAPSSRDALGRALGRYRRRLAATAAQLAERRRRLIRALAEVPPYPLAAQLALVARALERVGERQISQLDQITKRFGADLVRLGEILPPDPVLLPPADRVAELVARRWAALRLAGLAVAGALLAGGLATWLIAATVADPGTSADLLPGPLAGLHHGWIVGLVLASLTLLAGVSRRLLRDAEGPPDDSDVMLQSIPGVVLLAAAALCARMFWQAADVWLPRLGLTGGGAAPGFTLARLGIAAAGALLIAGLYALGDLSALAFARAAFVHARLWAAGIVADRDRRMERGRVLRIRMSEQTQAIRAAAERLPDSLRHEFQVAVGIPTNGSVAEAIDATVQSLLESDDAPHRPVRTRVGALAHFGVDLAMFALWAVAAVLAATSLWPVLVPSVTPSPVLAVLAALALPTAASLAGLMAKEAIRHASRAALSHRAIPSLGRPAVIALAVSLAVILAIMAGWLKADGASGNAMLAGVWQAGLVLSVALAALHLDAGLLAATRLVRLLALAAGSAGVHVAGGCLRVAESLFRPGEASLSADETGGRSPEAVQA